MSDPLMLSATCNLDASEACPKVSCRGRFLCEIGPGSTTAETVTRFIERRFEQAYGARPPLRIPRLLAMTTASGTLLAAVGIRGAAEEMLFLEDYLDAPIEAFLPGGGNTDRAHVAEIAHLAGVEAGVSRHLFASLTVWLRAHGFQWATFTATEPLFNSLRRMGIALLEVAPADPARLVGAGQGWGAYYAHGPVVVGVDVEQAYQAMSRTGKLRGTTWTGQAQEDEKAYVHSA